MTVENEVVVGLFLEDIEDVLQPIRESVRTKRVSGQFWIWAGANIAPINWVLGALGIGLGLGLRDTLIVLIAGKGHETTQQIGDTTLPFSDFDCARTALAAR